MAKVVPEGWRELSAIGSAQREIETLAQLADGLPDEYSIYHGLHWTRIDKGYRHWQSRYHFSFSLNEGY